MPVSYTHLDVYKRQVDRVHFERRVAVHELVEFLRAQRESRQHLARMVVLLAVSDNTSLNQRHDAVANHFGMNTEIMFISCLLYTSRCV